MRDWLLFNAFMAGISFTAAALLFVGLASTKALSLSAAVEPSVQGAVAIAAMVLTYFIWRAIWRRIQRS